jgi:glycosyltransferase involved in cell wall biosynthesis
VLLAAGPLATRVIHFLGGPIDKPTIVDLYDPAEIERIMLNASHRSPHDFNAVPVILDELFAYLRQGDFFICGSPEQFDFWMGTLLAAGRLNVQTLGPDFNVDHLIDVVPFGLPDEPPKPGAPVIKGVLPGIAPQDKVIYWGGGIWDWTDPLTLVEAVRIAREQRDDLRVLFGARTHFDQKIVPEMSVVARLMAFLERQGWVDRVVFFQDWIPYDQRGAYLLEADIGVSLFKRALENRYAIRSRLYDFLWCSVPCIVSQGDPMSRFLEEAHLAHLVEPGDVRGVAQAILDLLESAPERRSRLSAGDPEVLQMRWSAVVRPILDFLRQPRLAPDALEARKNLRYVVPLRRDWQRLHDEYSQRSGEWAMEREHLQQQVDALRSRRVVRLADRVGGLLNSLKKK